MHVGTRAKAVCSCFMLERFLASAVNFVAALFGHCSNKVHTSYYDLIAFRYSIVEWILSHSSPFLWRYWIPQDLSVSTLGPAEMYPKRMSA